ncbi:hypothetical protein [Spirulina subsalsa]|uniref:hypothetical protein n=1 Tax=Spirulina subsalsa TaxID=54311 RepID=UPI00038075C0|nr:hypothetical protein [Spirulina subsalsa]
MSEAIGTIFGFLGGTIVSCETGYRVLQHPNPHKTYSRLSEAKWFLALRWCEQFHYPAGILNYEGQLAFYNEASWKMGEENFLPRQYRPAIFKHCCALGLGESTTFSIPTRDGFSWSQVEIIAIETDPRYGRVALVRLL